MHHAAAILIGYLIGSIPFGLLIARVFGVPDIRKVGSGNIGATNVWRVAGRFPGILVMIGDIGKGVAAVLVAAIILPPTDLTEYFKLASGLAAIMGHIFPLFLRFKGGKGVNTALGVMVTLLPVESIIALAIFILVVIISRYISLGSILASFSFFLVVLLEWALNLDYVHPIYVPVSFLLAVLIIMTHRANIKRLLNGSESRFQLHPKMAAEKETNG
jgi:acyl phosphate:glycerol-3-phosphate acyltransferase